MTNCILCEQDNNNLTEKVDILDCNICGTKFWTGTAEANYEEYEKLYPKLTEQAEKIKNFRTPMEETLGRGVPYEGIIKIFTPRNTSLLDVGCGYGYVAWSLATLGYVVTGIDISKIAIEFAKKTFPLNFYAETVHEYKKRGIEHHVIYSIEVFEHVSDPKEFIKSCLEVAPQVVITTPNLEAYNSFWVSEEPPIHRAMYCKKSLEWLAKELKVDVSVQDKYANLIAVFKK